MPRDIEALLNHALLKSEHHHALFRLAKKRQLPFCVDELISMLSQVADTFGDEALHVQSLQAAIKTQYDNIFFLEGGKNKTHWGREMLFIESMTQLALCYFALNCSISRPTCLKILKPLKKHIQSMSLDSNKRRAISCILDAIIREVSVCAITLDYYAEFINLTLLTRAFIMSIFNKLTIETDNPLAYLQCAIRKRYSQNLKRSRAIIEIRQYIQAITHELQTARIFKSAKRIKLAAANKLERILLRQAKEKLNPEELKALDEPYSRLNAIYISYQELLSRSSPRADGLSTVSFVPSYRKAHQAQLKIDAPASLTH